MMCYRSPTARAGAKHESAPLLVEDYKSSGAYARGGFSGGAGVGLGIGITAPPPPPPPRSNINNSSSGSSNNSPPRWMASTDVQVLLVDHSRITGCHLL